MKHSLRLAALVLATVIMLSVISGCAAPVKHILSGNQQHHESGDII